MKREVGLELRGWLSVGLKGGRAVAFDLGRRRENRI